MNKGIDELSNVLHEILIGQHPEHQGFRFEALVSDQYVENIIMKYWNKLTSWSTRLGNITSTFIGLYMIGRIIKFMIDTIMHGRILYDIYGLGWQLIASFWDSLTSFLSHRSVMKRTSQQEKNSGISENNLAQVNVNEENIPMRPLYPEIHSQSNREYVSMRPFNSELYSRSDRIE